MLSDEHYRDLVVSDGSDCSEDGIDESDYSKSKNGLFADMPVISNVSNALLGISIFASPWGFQQSGILGGTIVILIISFLSFCTTSSLLDTQRQLFIKFGEVKSYPDIVQTVLGGSFWSSLVKVATVISCLGGCVGYLIFLGEVASQLFNMDMETAVLLSIVPLVLLSWIRSFRELTLFTTLGLVAIFVAIFVVFLDGLYEIDIQAIESTPLFVKRKWMNFLGPATFCFTAHYCVLSVAAETLVDSIDDVGDASSTPVAVIKASGYRALKTVPSSSSLITANGDNLEGSLTPSASISGDLKGPLIAAFSSPARKDCEHQRPSRPALFLVPPADLPQSPVSSTSAPSPRSLGRPLASAYALCSAVFILHGVSGFIMYQTADYVTVSQNLPRYKGKQRLGHGRLRFIVACVFVWSSKAKCEVICTFSPWILVDEELLWLILFQGSRWAWWHFYKRVNALLYTAHRDRTGNGVEPGCEERVCQNIILNVSDGPLKALVSVCLCAAILLSYVVLFVPAREHIEGAMLRFFGLADDESASSLGGVLSSGVFSCTWQSVLMNLVRALLVLITAAIALYVPYFGTVLGRVGGLTDALQAFVIPPLVFFNLDKTMKTMGTGARGDIGVWSGLDSRGVGVNNNGPSECSVLDPEAMCRLRMAESVVSGQHPTLTVSLDNDTPVKNVPFYIGVSSLSTSLLTQNWKAHQLWLLYSVILVWGIFIMSFTAFEMAASVVKHLS